MVKEETVYGTDKLDVKVSRTQIIIPMQKRSCPCGFLFKLLNGEIVVSGAMSGVDWPASQIQPLPPGQTSRELSWRRSKDGGQTWNETPAWPTYAPYQFLDGEIMQISGRWWQIEIDQEQKYSFALFRSIDNGYSFDKEKVFVTDIPELASVKYLYSDKDRCANVNHQIVKLYTGNLLASAQGKFKNDIKERTFIIQSDDRGKTWKYLSTVAFDMNKEDKIRPLGFDEPNLLVLPDGNILCFMRSGSRQGQSLYMSRSKDNGKTWSNADPIADRGVYPTACRMQNGIIAVVYGRPDDWLMFSLDEGETWINHFCFNHTPDPFDCGSYDWIEEIAPDTLLAVYSQTSPDDNMKSAITGTYITVKSK